MIWSANKMSGSFDTLAAARKLEATGMDQKQADAVTGVIRDDVAEFATRDGLPALRSDVAALHSGRALPGL